MINLIDTEQAKMNELDTATSANYDMTSADMSSLDAFLGRPGISLVTDQVSPDDVARGRAFLSFMGLGADAASLGDCIGTSAGGTKYEIPINHFKEDGWRHMMPHFNILCNAELQKAAEEDHRLSKLRPRAMTAGELLARMDPPDGTVNPKRLILGKNDAGTNIVMAEELTQGLHPDNYYAFEASNNLPAGQGDADDYSSELRNGSDLPTPPYAERKNELEQFDPRHNRGPLQPEELEWLQFVDFDQLEDDVQDEVTNLFGQPGAPETFMVEEFNELARAHKPAADQLNQANVPQAVVQTVDGTLQQPREGLVPMDLDTNMSPSLPAKLINQPNERNMPQDMAQTVGNALQQSYGGLAPVNLDTTMSLSLPAKPTIQPNDRTVPQDATQAAGNASQPSHNGSEPMDIDIDSGMLQSLPSVNEFQKRQQMPNPQSIESNQRTEETSKPPSNESQQQSAKALEPAIKVPDMDSKEYLEGWLLAANAWAKADRKTFRNLIFFTKRPKVFQRMQEVLERPDADNYQVLGKEMLLQELKKELRIRETIGAKRFPGVWYPGMSRREMVDNSFEPDEFPWPLDDGICPIWDHPTMYEEVERRVDKKVRGDNQLNRHFGTQADRLAFTALHTTNLSAHAPTPSQGYIDKDKAAPARVPVSTDKWLSRRLIHTGWEYPPSYSHAGTQTAPEMGSTVQVPDDLSGSAPGAFHTHIEGAAPMPMPMASIADLSDSAFTDFQLPVPPIPSIADDDDEELEPEIGRSYQGPNFSDVDESMDDEMEDVDDEEGGDGEGAAAHSDAAPTSSTGPDLALGSLPAWILGDELVMRNLTTPRPVVEDTDPALKALLEQKLAEVRHLIT